MRDMEIGKIVDPSAKSKVNMPDGVRVAFLPNNKSEKIMKNNAVLIQQIYPGLGYDEMLKMQIERNQVYCDSWGIDYQYEFGNPVPDMDPFKGSWAKITLIKQALEKGYDYVIWLDADTIIKDWSVDLRDGCVYGHIGACWQRIPQLHHWNVGALYFSNSPPTLAFLREWLLQYPGNGDGWNEQGIFNRLAMSSKVVQTISDRWNATMNHTECPDAVVLGYHGVGSAQQRIDFMKMVLKELDK